MKAVKEKIDDVTVLIQTVDEDEDLEIIGSTSSEPDIMETGIEEMAGETFKRAKSIITGIARDIGTDLSNLQSAVNKICPKQVEIQFSMGFSAKADAWILGTSGEYLFSVTMTWEPKNDG